MGPRRMSNMSLHRCIIPVLDWWRAFLSTSPHFMIAFYTFNICQPIVDINCFRTYNSWQLRVSTKAGVKGIENCAFGPQYSHKSYLGTSALKAPVNTGSCWPGDWRHSLKLQWKTAIRMATVAVKLWLTKRAILTTFDPNLRNLVIIANRWEKGKVWVPREEGRVLPVSRTEPYY
jgi:hypothetical protein